MGLSDLVVIVSQTPTSRAGHPGHDGVGVTGKQDAHHEAGAIRMAVALPPPRPRLPTSGARGVSFLPTTQRQEAPLSIKVFDGTT